jgi:transcription elongation factor GreB
VADKNYITPGGYKRLVDELSELATVERPRVVREVADAAAEGDRSENAAYIYGKRRLREIDRRMRFLTVRLRNVQVVDARGRSSDRVFFGAHVTIEDEDGESATYQIVGVDEFDVNAGKISWQSPVGRALLGKRVDDTAIVRMDERQRELTVVEIEYEPEVALPAQPELKAKPKPVKKKAKSRAR